MICNFLGPTPALPTFKNRASKGSGVMELGDKIVGPYHTLVSFLLLVIQQVNLAFVELIQKILVADLLSRYPTEL